MKAVSEVIATILMLMVTLAISGTAYLFINAVFTQQTQGLEMIDAFCIEGVKDNSTIVLRNIGTNVVNTADINVIQTSPVPTTELRWSSSTIKPGDIVTLYDECEGSGARICTYRIIPLAGRPLSVAVTCS